MGLGGRWAASWNLSSLNPVFLALGHSVAGKNMCCIFEVLDHVTEAGFVNQSTQWFQEEREKERKRVYVSERERREKEREAECNRLSSVVALRRTSDWQTQLLLSFSTRFSADSTPNTSSPCAVHIVPSVSLLFAPVFLITSLCLWDKETDRGHVRAWVRCVTHVPLPLFFMCVCVCVCETAWAGRLSFLRTALIENRDFERGRKNNRNS